MEILGVRHHQFIDSRSISLSVDSPSRMMISLSATIRPNSSVRVCTQKSCEAAGNTNAELMDPQQSLGDYIA